MMRQSDGHRVRALRYVVGHPSVSSVVRIANSGLTKTHVRGLLGRSIGQRPPELRLLEEDEAAMVSRALQLVAP